jgi:hypothetical protein
MAVIAKHTELRCKLCASDQRERIDALLERRSKRERDEEGNAINLDYVLVELARLGIENPNADNVKNHWKKHCEVISEQEKTEMAESVEGLVEKLNDGTIEFADADAALDWIITQGVTEAQTKLQLGGKVGITIDQILKAIDSKTRRKSNEAQDELLRGLGGALGAWAGKALEGGAQPKAIDAGVVEHEVVVEDG